MKEIKAMRKMTIGMHHINVTQKEWNPKKTSSHYLIPGVDLAGEDTGIDFYKALDGRYLSLGQWGGKWGTAFIPVDEKFKPQKTELADGRQGYYGIYLCHDNHPHIRGRVYNIGDVMYMEGTSGGKATGNHIHMEVFQFDPHNYWKFPEREYVKGNVYNTYRFKRYWNPSELWVATDYSTIVNLNGQTFGLTTLNDCRG